MQIDILTLFPKIIDSYTNESVIKRAQEKNIVKINSHNIRDYTTNKQNKVDDRPFGGGAGMILQAQPILSAVDNITKQTKIKNSKKRKFVILSPRGKIFNQAMAKNWAKKYSHLVLISGRYEGIDDRVKKICKAEEISIGPYVMTDGDIGALAIISTVVRLIPGVLGNQESLNEETYNQQSTQNWKSEIRNSKIFHEYPQYTRPENLIYKNKSYRVPKVLLSGNHKEILEWRKKKSNI